MILLPRSVRVYVATMPVDLRRSFDGLSNVVRSLLAQDPLSGHLFVFLNKRRTLVKILVWTRGGFTIVQKRLERGTFVVPAREPSDAATMELDAHELAMLLEGLELRRMRARPRWEPARRRPLESLRVVS
jgi:transposase